MLFSFPVGVELILVGQLRTLAQEGRVSYLQEDNMLKRDVYIKVFLLAVVCAVLMTGCGKKTPPPETQVTGEGLGPAESLETAASEEVFTSEGRTSAPMLPVYFAFDSARIEGDQVERLEKNGAFLKSHPDINVRIEGNCDPRGTKEYNLALGERRAQSARRYLVNLGIDGKRLSTISWGEEKLLLFGHDELSWAQDRRDDFVIMK